MRGWYVGWITRPRCTAFFALRIDIDTPADLPARAAIPRHILRRLGLLPRGRTEASPPAPLKP